MVDFPWSYLRQPTGQTCSRDESQQGSTGGCCLPGCSGWKAWNAKAACQTDRRGGGSAGCCPTDCLIPVMVLKCRVQELDTGSGCQVPLPGEPCTGAPVLTGVRALEWGQGPSRKQPDLDSSHSIPTSLPNTALKAQRPLPGLHPEQQVTQDSSETLHVLGTLLPIPPKARPETFTQVSS